MPSYLFFPLFEQFKQLRTLNLHYHPRAVDPKLIQRALHSLLTTTIETLSIIVIDQPKTLALNTILSQIWRSKTLKRLSLFVSCDSVDWSNFQPSTSNVEYVTISDIDCTYENLQAIFRSAPHLKYVNIRLTCSPLDAYAYFRRKNIKKIVPTLMVILKTDITLSRT
ncbi:unnamed protein product [Rotaria sp. Silwood2]|nr:unnamed protein product [Rotaria sp. Silwood2]CAF3014267.1 unnamed protein product [Rotaria sp. Silwood2]CAF3330157.1 unnamed protein product [Rotaria sp. Silwood2]CAF4141559.1 unnamed protein product [Rotaria sp. Silwood2]CAF4262489.1 unnamed protein product [Rotaria sp. Silwood2]